MHSVAHAWLPLPTSGGNMLLTSRFTPKQRMTPPRIFKESWTFPAVFVVTKSDISTGSQVISSWLLWQQKQKILRWRRDKSSLFCSNQKQIFSQEHGPSPAMLVAFVMRNTLKTGTYLWLCRNILSIILYMCFRDCVGFACGAACLLSTFWTVSLEFHIIRQPHFFAVVANIHPVSISVHRPILSSLAVARVKAWGRY